MSRQFRIFMLILGAANLVLLGGWMIQQIMTTEGLQVGGGVHPIGGDFINLWTAGRMLLSGAAGEIYTPSAFSDFQQGFLTGPIGHRIWAYPPHSLLLVWPFGLVGFWVALAGWTVLGLIVLAWGARRIGLDRTETAILLLSPAALLCVNYGQTGSLAAGLLMLALAEGGKARSVNVVAAIILTIKPQLGVLLPVYWAVQRYWKLIALTAIAVLAVAALSVLVLDADVWSGYVGETLTELKQLELHGSGLFVFMIPSVFMSLRILSGDGDLALGLHMGFAFAVLALCIWLMVRAQSPRKRQALVFAGTAVITPYLHLYDMSLIVIAALLAARLWAGETGRTVARLREYGVVLAWVLPYITFVGNYIGWPVSPLFMLGLLAMVVLAPDRLREDA